MKRGETVLTGNTDPHLSAFQVMMSAAGYYIGTSWTGDDCEACRAEKVSIGESHPGTRETVYFETEHEAQEALGTWQSTGRLPGVRK